MLMSAYYCWSDFCCLFECALCEQLFGYWLLDLTTCFSLIFGKYITISYLLFNYYIATKSLLFLGMKAS